MRVSYLRKQHPGSGAVAGVRGGDHHPQQQAERIDDDVPLAPVDQLAAVEPTAVQADDGVRLDGLRVDHPGRRFRIPPQLFADRCPEPVVELP